MRNEPDDWSVFTERLFDQSRFAIKLGLENIQKALERESIQSEFPIIIVGGTNGKGQTSAFISNILEAHGYCVGLFTSPHLIEFRERVRVNGVPLTRKKVLEVGKYVLESYSKGDLILTFFEMCVLISILLFRKEKIDIAIMEIGLGGRLDAVNALDRVLTVITNIGMDHQEYLGHSIEEIASEKFAIMRPQIPTVLGEQKFDLNFNYETPLFHADPAKSFREKNANTARLASSVFLGDEFDPMISSAAIKNTRWPGRAEKVCLRDSFEVIVDAAHNPLGLETLFAEIDMDSFDVIIFAAMKDKDLKTMGQILRGSGKEIWGCSVNSHRAASREHLEAHMELSRFDTLDHLLMMKPKALVCGSIYLLGELFDWGGIKVSELTIKVDPKQ